MTNDTDKKLYRFVRKVVMEEVYIVPASSEEEAQTLVENYSTDYFIDSYFMYSDDDDFTLVKDEENDNAQD